MADFVGFTAGDEHVIVASKPLIEKHLPQIVSDFYDHLLRYPPTRKFFLKRDGALDEAYLQLRMRHNANFWRRTAEGGYDDEYAGYIAYVGRAHTTHGADPTVYIPERYVIGQVGFVQHAIRQALHIELHAPIVAAVRSIDPTAGRSIEMCCTSELLASVTRARYITPMRL